MASTCKSDDLCDCAITRDDLEDAEFAFLGLLVSASKDPKKLRFLQVAYEQYFKPASQQEVASFMLKPLCKNCGHGIELHPKASSSTFKPVEGVEAALKPGFLRKGSGRVDKPLMVTASTSASSTVSHSATKTKSRKEEKVDVNTLFPSYSVDAILESTEGILSEKSSTQKKSIQGGAQAAVEERHLHPMVAMAMCLLLTVEDDLIDIAWCTELPALLCLTPPEMELQQRLLKRNEDEGGPSVEEKVLFGLPVDTTTFSNWGRFSVIEAAVLASDVDLVRRLKTGNIKGVLDTACATGDLALVQKIVEDPTFDCTQPIHAFFKALFNAVQSLNLAVVKYILDTLIFSRSANPTWIWEQIRLLKHAGEPVMVAAAKTGSGGVVQLLLSRGLPPEDLNDEDVSPLMAAVNERHDAVVRVFLNNPYYTFETEEIQRAFLGAVARGQLGIMEVFLKGGCDPDYLQKFPFPVTPVGLAVKRRQLKALERLLKAGANPNISYGDTNALTEAKSRGDIEMIQLLQAKGAMDYVAKKRRLSFQDEFDGSYDDVD